MTSGLYLYYTRRPAYNGTDGFDERVGRLKAQKYMQIVDWATSQISSGAFWPGDRFLSEAALGARFGFSRQTVRRALEVLERDGRISRAQGSGTFVAGARAQARPAQAKPDGAATIGVISTYLDDYIFPGIIRGIEAVCAAAGYAVQLASTQNEASGEARALLRMLDSRPAGLIVEPTQSGLPCLNAGLYRLIAERGIPLVFMDEGYPEVNAPCVALDGVAAGRMAARHLLDAGHRRIAGVFTHSNRQGLLRYLGYAEALREFDLFVSDDDVHWFSKDNMREILNGRRLSESLARCTAAVCFNDHLALRLVDLLRGRGVRVPEDLSVISIDNSESARRSGLTSVAHPGVRLGEAAAKLLLSIAGGAQGKTILFPPELVTRETVREMP